MKSRVSMALKTRLNVSWEGMPFGSSRKRPSHAQQPDSSDFDVNID